MGIFDGIVAEDNTSLDISTVNYDLEKAQNAELALEELQTERFIIH